MVSDASFSALGEALCIERDNDGLRAASLRLCIQFRALRAKNFACLKVLENV